MARILSLTIALSVAAALAGCSQETPTPAVKQGEKTAAAAQPQSPPLPADTPVPPGMMNRVDSAMPGTAYHVIQGQIASPLPEAIETVRKLAASNEWKEAPGTSPPSEPAVATIVYEKDTRQLKATLVRRSNTETTLNMLVGPR